MKPFNKLEIIPIDNGFIVVIYPNTESQPPKTIFHTSLAEVAEKLKSF